MSYDDIISMLSNMLIGSGQTLSIFVLTAIFSVPFGFLIALGRKSRFKILSVPIRFYQLVARGTPLMLQLMFIFYAPSFIWGLNYDRFTACILAFVLNYTAYFGEIFRGGIESIPFGQNEAAKVLGFSKMQTFLKITLPQVIKRILPATGNEFMTLVKDTALAQVIAVPQLFEVAKKSANSNVSIFPLITAAVIYLILNAIVESAFKHGEKKLDYYR